MEIVTKKSLWRIENETRLIRRRLRSSNRSGDYYILSEVWGINNAPYEPLFEVISERFYQIKIIPELVSELRFETVAGIMVPFPSCEIIKEVKKIAEPVVLGIGERAVCSSDTRDAIRYFKEFFIFDKSRSIDVYRKRAEMFEKIDAKVEWGEIVPVQGHLNACEGEIKKEDLEALKGDLREIRELYLNWKLFKWRLFNHRFHPKTREWYYWIGKDNELIFIFDEAEERAKVVLHSYDHPTVEVVIGKGRVVKFSHPFPSPGID